MVWVAWTFAEGLYERDKETSCTVFEMWLISVKKSPSIGMKSLRFCTLRRYIWISLFEAKETCGGSEMEREYVVVFSQRLIW